jgi:hypothetical protein
MSAQRKWPRRLPSRRRIVTSGLDGPRSRGVDVRLVASVLAALMMAGGAALFGYALVRVRATIGTMV